MSDPVSFKEILGAAGSAKVREVPCRVCRTATLELNDVGWMAAKKASQVLLQRGEPPLDEKKLLICTPCRQRELEALRVYEDRRLQADADTAKYINQKAKRRGHLYE